ncbi:MAG: oxygenase MpaB family protein [Burkholderiaceae bacterium]
MTGPDTELDRAAHSGDGLADRTVSALMGGYPLPEAMARLGQASQLMAGWTCNADLTSGTWRVDGQSPDIVEAMARYAREGSALPDWADPARIDEAESVFMAYGPLSCTLLFCASLPACYQMPQLAEVLHLSGQLEQHTEHRIRQTAAMIFPVMMDGGLTTPGGGVVAQVLKVRLIHATIRHLIVTRQADEAHTLRDSRHQVWCRHDWNTEQLGLPCSQLELAFTLLTFHAVFLKAMRTLNMGLTGRQETAYLHAWNVVGHVLGIDASLMAHDMDSALALLDRFQSCGAQPAGRIDARPALGQALVKALSDSIRVPVIRHLPVPMIERLLGRPAAQSIGVGPQAGWATRTLFRTGMFLIGSIDRVGRLFAPGFSLTRMFTRAIGYHLLTRFLLDQTRPLALPERLLDQMHNTVDGWHADVHAPAWLNRVEDWLTTSGSWVPPSARKVPT